MLPQRNSAPLIMPIPLLCSLLGLAFCAWNAWGNTFEFCVTAGCELNDSMTIGGVSLWWFGCTAFALLTIASFSGRPWLGTFVAGVCLIADVALLALMLVTAPCVSCLVVALIFALTFMSFRHANTVHKEKSTSLLWYLWLMFFVVNLGAVAHDAFSPWPMVAPKDGNAAISVYFSPSCPSCYDAVKAFATNTQVAFYPVIEHEHDVIKIAQMLAAVEQGKSLLTAFEGVQKNTMEQGSSVQSGQPVQPVQTGQIGQIGQNSESAQAAQSINTTGQNPQVNAVTPSTQTESEFKNPLGFIANIGLHFKLLINRAHIIQSGSNVVPFIEYRGLPAFLVPKKAAEPEKKRENVSAKPVEKEAVFAGPVQELTKDAASGEEFLPAYDNSGSMQYLQNTRDVTLPAELEIDTNIAGACGGANTQPCPE